MKHSQNPMECKWLEQRFCNKGTRKRPCVHSNPIAILAPLDCPDFTPKPKEK